MLIQLHPNDGFIYDKNTQQAVQMICATATKADALQKYHEFVQSYSDLFCPLRDRLTRILDERESGLQAARIIDKFLWLLGTRDAKKRAKVLVKNSSAKQRKIASKIVSWLRNIAEA